MINNVEYEVPLPSNWQRVRLSEVVDAKVGLGTKAQKEDTDVVYLRISDIQGGGTLQIREPRFVPMSVPGWEHFELQPGDIVVARTGSNKSIGKSYLFPGQGSPNLPLHLREKRFVGASFLYQLRPRLEHILPSYLGLYFQTPFYWHELSSKTRRFTLTNLSLEKLKSFYIPLPPLNDQKAIVDRLQAAHTVLERRYESLALTKEMRVAMLNLAKPNALINKASVAKPNQLNLFGGMASADLQQGNVDVIESLVQQQQLSLTLLSELFQALLIDGFSGQLNFSKQSNPNTTHLASQPIKAQETDNRPAYSPRPRSAAVLALSEFQRLVYEAALRQPGYFSPETLKIRIRSETLHLEPENDEAEVSPSVKGGMLSQSTDGMDNFNLIAVQRALQLLSASGFIVPILLLNTSRSASFYQLYYRSLRERDSRTQDLLPSSDDPEVLADE